MNPIPVKYVGSKTKFTDNHLALTGLVWTPGQIHFVPANVAVKLLPHEDIFARATEDDLSDPANIGYVIDPDNTPEETAEEKEEREDQELALMQNIPNLAPLAKAEIAAFAKREFGIDLDAGAMKKAEMLESIRSISSSRTAFAKPDAGTVRVAIEVPPLAAAGTVTIEEPVRIEGSIDVTSNVVVPKFVPDVEAV